MNFDLTDEQTALQDALRGYLRRHYRFEDRAAYLRDGGWRPEVWQAYANELGLFRATLPVDEGGFGGGGIETLVIAEQFGAVLALEPYVEAMVLGLTLLRESGPGTEQLISGAVDGTIRVIPALYEVSGRFDLTRIRASARSVDGKWWVSGRKTVVTGGPIATHFLVGVCAAPGSGDPPALSLFLVDAGSPNLHQERYGLIDGRSASDVTFEEAEARLIGSPGGALPAIDSALDAAVAAVCGEAVGVMQSLLEQTIAYAKQRHQFGQAISRFQVLQHRMVDMLSQVEQSRSLAIMAALSLGLPSSERRRAVSAAKAFISEAVISVAQSAVQIHGAIGTTDECAISHYFRRATVLGSQFGTAAWHRQVMSANADSPGARASEAEQQPAEPQLRRARSSPWTLA